MVAVLLLCAALVVTLFGCGGDEDTENGTVSNQTGSGSSGDIRVGVGKDSQGNDIKAQLGDATVSVESFESAFQPVSPAQKLSDEVLVAPASGESFYQARVMIENKGKTPLRIDPEHFVCRIGNTVTSLEPTRSGPVARSIIGGTSLLVVVTFRGKAGVEPILMYSPPWYDGVAYFSVAYGNEASATTTTAPAVETTVSTEAQ